MYDWKLVRSLGVGALLLTTAHAAGAQATTADSLAAAMAKLEVAQARFDSLRARLDSVDRTRRIALARVDTLTAARKSLTEELTRVVSLDLPQNFLSPEVRTSDSKAEIITPVSGFGRVSVALRLANGVVLPSQSNSVPSNRPTMRFAGLPSATDFCLVASVIPSSTAVGGTRQVSPVRRQGCNAGEPDFDSNFRGRTRAAAGAPTFVTVKPVARATALVFDYVATEMVAVQLVVRELGNGGLAAAGAGLVFGASLATDSLGLATSSVAAATNSVSATGLQTGKAYLWTLQAINESGKLSAVSSGTMSTTAGVPQFDKALDIRFDPVAGFVVRWPTSVRPDSVRFVAKFKPANAPKLAEIFGTWGWNDATGVNEVILPTSKILTAGMATTPPEISIKMWHGELAGGSSSMTFTLGLEVSRTALSSASDAAKSIATAVVESTGRNRRRVEWADIGRTALSLLAPIIVP